MFVVPTKQIQILCSKIPFLTFTECKCDENGSDIEMVDENGTLLCSPNGQCYCKINYSGKQCETCADGFYYDEDTKDCLCKWYFSYTYIHYIG